MISSMFKERNPHRRQEKREQTTSKEKATISKEKAVVASNEREAMVRKEKEDTKEEIEE